MSKATTQDNLRQPKLPKKRQPKKMGRPKGPPTFRPTIHIPKTWKGHDVEGIMEELQDGEALSSQGKLVAEALVFYKRFREVAERF